jgi:hypothetical protein
VNVDVVAAADVEAVADVAHGLKAAENVVTENRRH